MWATHVSLSHVLFFKTLYKCKKRSKTSKSEPWNQKFVASDLHRWNNQWKAVSYSHLFNLGRFWGGGGGILRPWVRAEPWLDRKVAGEKNDLMERSWAESQQTWIWVLALPLSVWLWPSPSHASSNFCELSPWKMSRKATYCENKMRSYQSTLETDKHPRKTLIKLVKAKTVS